MEIFLVVEGKKQKPSFEINFNESLQNHFPKCSNYRFVLFKKKLYSTTTLVKEFINESQETILLTAISDEQIVQKYNRKTKKLDNALIEIKNYKLELNQQKNQTNIEKQNKSNLMQEDRKQQQQLEEYQNFILTNSLNNTFLTQKLFGSSNKISQNSNTLSLPSDLYKSQNVESYNILSNDEDKENFTIQMLQAGNLTPCNLQEVYEKEQNCIQDLESNKMVHSELLTVQLTCFFCNLVLRDNFIQTNCLHTYHEECLLQFINTQALYNPSISQFTCICLKQIKPQLLHLFKEHMQSRKLRNQVYNNQLEEIKSKQQHKYIKCSNGSCEYFCVNSDDSKTYNFKCPNCLENIQNNQ